MWVGSPLTLFPLQCSNHPQRSVARAAPRPVKARTRGRGGAKNFRRREGGETAVSVFRRNRHRLRDQGLNKRAARRGPPAKVRNKFGGSSRPGCLVQSKSEGSHGHGAMRAVR